MNINNNISYFLSANDTIDIVLLSKVNKKYPLHTHAEHYTIGIVVDGKIAIETAQDQYICEADDIFIIPIDIPHSINPVKDDLYTMLKIAVL